jgi:hypothetical protein
MAPQQEAPKEAVITAASPVDIPAVDFPGEDLREVDLGVSDVGPPEQVVPEAHPVLVAGGRWVEALEAEDLMAEASAEVVAEAPGDSSKSEIESIGGGS